MFQIDIPAGEFWDEVNNQFVYTKAITLTLEHSLVSLSKWESKWCKPFLVKDAKTTEEIIDYIRCMTLTQNVDPYIYMSLTPENLKEITSYIDGKHTATTIKDNPNAPKNREIITSELIYYWMIALNIPFECQKWPLDRLLTLIRVCNIKNKQPEKIPKNQLMSRNAALNAARRKALNSKG